MARAVRLTTVLLALMVWLPAPGRAADTTIDFEQPGPGTTITNQYADVGGPGQGVVFGPLPNGAAAGLLPTIRAAAGQASSGTQAADVSTLAGCEFCTPGTTGTFTVPRSRISVHVGYLGALAAPCTPDGPDCAQVTLRAYDAAGAEVARSASATVRRGAGMATVLTVQTLTAQIVGFRVGSAAGTDTNETVAIDDLSFDVPAVPPPPDFSLTAASVDPVMRQGQTITDTIAIGRLAGSTGDVQFTVGGTLPPGVHAALAPNPAAGASTTLTLTADPEAEPTGANPIALTVIGTPSGAATGPAARTATVRLQVHQAFDVRAAGPAVVDLSPCVVAVPFTVSRDFSLTGPVGLTVTGVSGGLTAVLTPNQATFPNGAGAETVSMDVTAPATGVAVGPTVLTVHATAPPLAERTASVTVHGACPAQYDAQVTSLQITQGTQSRFLPARDGVHAAITRYADIPGAAKLRSDGPTVVRAYADLNWGPAEGVPRVPMVLAGYAYDRNGTPHALPGSPLTANSGTRTLRIGPIDTTVPEMESETLAYSFTLPPAWTRGQIGISAQLQPALPPAQPVFSAGRRAAGNLLTTGRVLAPCTTPACALNDYMALTAIPFYGAPLLTITPLQLTVNGVALPDPESVFKWVRLTTPLQLSLKPYQATIDISDIAAGSGDSNAKNSAVENRVDDWTCDKGTTAIGVNTGVARGLTRSGSWCWSALASFNSAVVEFKRPLTSVGHEWYHLLGRKHASPGCGGADNGQTAEAWPPDQRGNLQSVGLDTQLGSGKNGAPYAVVPGSPGKWYDLMSYCASSNQLANPASDALTLDSWISVHNWNAVMDSRAYLRSAPALKARAAARVPSLVVTATVPPAGPASIVSVTPTSTPPPPTSGSAFRLVAFDAAGGQTADVAMLEAQDHVDGQATPAALSGAVPAAGVVRVAIVRDGATLATRAASGSAPTVGVPRVTTGPRTGTIRWTARDADRDALVVALDYSADAGRTYRRIFRGPDRGFARVPARYLSRAARARVRVTVNDGFREATATSKAFRAPGAAPTVSITSPQSGLRQPSDATLLLAGSAFDDTGAALTGKRLRWLAGRRVLGTGAQIAVAGLPVGTRQVTLEARDGAGRRGRATVRVVLGASRPLFLRLSAPKAVLRTARTLVLRISSSLPARLAIGGKGIRTQVFATGRATRALRVSIPRGKAALNLKLALRAGGPAAPVTPAIVRVARRPAR